MKKLTESEVKRFKEKNIITESGNDFWADVTERVVISEENICKFFAIKADDINYKFSENDVATKRGRSIFKYADIVGAIKF